MTAKQSQGVYAPDGSLYITLTDGDGNLATVGGGSSDLTINTTTITGGSNTNFLYDNSGTVGELSPAATLAAISGAAGASSSTDNAAARFDSTTGKIIQNSALIIADTTGSISRSGNGGIPVQGTNTNDNAASGYIGEYISSTVLVGSAVSLTSGTTANVTSISLTAGDWDLWGNVVLDGNSSSTMTVKIAAISDTSATLPTKPGNGAYFLNQGSVTGVTTFAVMPVGTTRVSIASTATYYLVTQANFGVSTMTAYGFLGARRVR